MAKVLGRCAVCGGTLFTEDGVRKCLACSREIRAYAAKKVFYDYNQAAILDSIKSQGRPKTTIAWRIPGSTLSYLVRRWSKNDDKPPAPGPDTTEEASPEIIKEIPEKLSDHHKPPARAELPALPAWSDTWSEPVKLKWLEIWLYLEIKNNREVKAIG